MSVSLITRDLAVYSLQIGLLVALATLVPAFLRLHAPKARLLYWQILLAACLLLPAARPWKQEAASGAAQISTGVAIMASAHPAARHRFPASELALLLLSAGMLARLGWLAAGFWRLRQYRRRSAPLEPAPALETHAALRVSEEISGPVTFGFRRPVVLLPAHFPYLAEPVQEAILCHEILHVQRRDWLFTVAEEFVRAAFWFHPAVWWLLGEIQLTREQTVDCEAIGITRSRDEYLDALLAIAGAPAHPDLAPAPLFLRRRNLKRRVVSIVKEVRMSKTRLISAFAAGVAMLAVACWFVTGAIPLVAAAQIVDDAPGVAVEMNGAQLMHRVPVTYPGGALEKGIQGTVVAQVKLDANGNVTDAAILSGPDELRKSVLQSVLEWHFRRDEGPGVRQVSVTFQSPKSGSGGQQAAESMQQVRTGSFVAVAPAAPPRPQAAQVPPPLRMNPSITPADLAQSHVLKGITVSGLSDEARDQLLAALPVHEGDTVSPDMVNRLREVVGGFDEHLKMTFLVGNGEATIRIAVPTALPESGSAAQLAAAKLIAEARAGGAPGSAAQLEAAAKLLAEARDASGAPARLRISGNLQQAKLISQTRPAYPLEAKQTRIQGVVRLNAVIAKDGTISDLSMISGEPVLAKAALESVRQWVYQPTLLNGNPVEVTTEIDVNFTLAQ